ncbi:MAG: TetR/AcrR family transcriptional regulator [Defluviitaleaceae bacterium]|nr:TetR/AcrR family transcriptional regulator [Defluviitaleaceae bacterium]
MPKETFFRLRDEKQESILRSAIHEFNEFGYERAKISDIAKNAHVATGSIYQYFADKNELFMYCAQWAFDIFMQKLDTRLDIKNMDIFEYFRENLTKVEVLKEERELVKFMQVLSQQPHMMKLSMKEMYDKSDIFIQALIQNSKQKDFIRKDINDELLRDYFVAVTERFKLRWMENKTDFLDGDLQSGQISEEVNQMMELLINGMGGDKNGIKCRN